MKVWILLLTDHVVGALDYICRAILEYVHVESGYGIHIKSDVFLQIYGHVLHEAQIDSL